MDKSDSRQAEQVLFGGVNGAGMGQSGDKLLMEQEPDCGPSKAPPPSPSPTPAVIPTSEGS